MTDRVFSRVANTYDIARAMISIGLDRKWKMLAASTVPTGARHLDVGTGTGGMLEPFGVGSFRIGLDHEIAMILQAERGVERGIDWVAGELGSLPFRERQFDLVTASYLLRYVDPNSMVAEINRVVCPGGTVLFCDLCAPAGRLTRALLKLYLFLATTIFGLIFHLRPAVYWHLWRTIGEFDPAVIGNLLQAAGYEDVRVRFAPTRLFAWVTGRVPI